MLVIGNKLKYAGAFSAALLLGCYTERNRALPWLLPVLSGGESAYPRFARQADVGEYVVYQLRDLPQGVA